MRLLFTEWQRLFMSIGLTMEPNLARRTEMNRLVTSPTFCFLEDVVANNRRGTGKLTALARQVGWFLTLLIKGTEVYTRSFVAITRGRSAMLCEPIQHTLDSLWRFLPPERLCSLT